MDPRITNTLKWLAVTLAASAGALLAAEQTPDLALHLPSLLHTICLYVLALAPALGIGSTGLARPALAPQLPAQPAPAPGPKEEPK